MQIALCDDDDNFLLETAQMLRLWSEKNALPVDIHCFHNGDALLTRCKTTKFDIVFLDIIMPMLNGMDTAAELRSRDKAVQIIFLTSSADFALQSYSVKASDYCLKPVSPERLEAVMNECAAVLRHASDYLVVKVPGGYRKIFLHEIECIEAQNKHCCFFLSSGRTVEAMQPLYSFEQQLSQTMEFYKCHRSYLVYIPNINYFSPAEITTKSGKHVPIARGYSKDFQDTYFSVMFHDP